MRSPELGSPGEPQNIDKKIVIIDNKEAIENEARDAADEKMTVSKNELRGFGGLMKKIWKHNLFNDYYRQKEISKARDEIISEKNLYIAETRDASAHNYAMDNLIRRFSEEYEEMVHTEAGEERRVIENTVEEAEIHRLVKELIISYASGLIDESTFKEERVRIISGVLNMSRNDIESEVKHTDNLLTIAKQVKNNIEHGKKMEDLDLDFEIIIGKAKSGVRTEAQFNSIDKIVEKIQSTKLGSLANETTLASAVAILYSVAAGVSQRVARSKVAAWGTFGATALVAAGVAGARESRKTEEDRRQHSREMAKGKIFDPSSPIRVQLEQFRYQTVSADSLISAINNEIAKDSLSQQEAINLLGTLAEAEARIKISDQQNIDLISYTDALLIEKERFDLDIARAKAKVYLKNLTDAGTIQIQNGEDVSSFLDKITDTVTDQIIHGNSGLERKNTAFKQMKQKRVAIAALKGLASGLIIGSAFQESAALLKDTEQGFVESLLGKSSATDNVHSVTPLEKLRLLFAGGEPDSISQTTNESLIDYLDHPLSDGDIVRLPEGVELVPMSSTSQEYNLVSDGEIIASNLNFANGQFTAESISLLSEKGIDLTTSVNLITTESETTFSSKEYLENNGDLFNQTRRELWFDNDTPAPVFDKNELRLQWGNKGSGITPDGKFVFNVSGMTEDGSYHGKFSTDASRAITEGKLKMIFSLSKDTQSMTVEVPVDEFGKVVVDPDSEIGKLFFEEVDGKAIFTGKYAEVVEKMGEDADGASKYRILSTHIGNGKDSIPGVITDSDEVYTTTLKLPVPEDIRPDPSIPSPFMVPPPFIPLIDRSPLEKLSTKVGPVPPGYYYMGEDVPDSRVEKFSDTLKTDPNASLDHYKEADQYLSTWEGEHTKTIQSLATQAGPMLPDCRLSVCIPVAGHQEGENIYKTLLNFTNQSADPKQYEISLLVNQPDFDKEGKTVLPDNTLAEIKRFKAEHPEINVRIMEIVLPGSRAKIGNIRKLLTDATLLRHHKRGNNAPDLIIVSNDADNKGTSPLYLENFIVKFDRNPKVDSMLGQIDWDPDSYIRNPLVHVGTRMFQYVNAQVRRGTKRTESSGANFAFRSSIYSAIRGGYNSETTLGEDNEFGATIRAARRGTQRIPIGYAGARVSRIYTSSRRAEKAVKDGLSPVEMWSRGFSAFDDSVRKVRWEELTHGVDYTDKEQTKKLVESLEIILNRTVAEMSKWYQFKSADEEILKNAMQWLGIKFIITPKNEVKITDASMLLKGLAKYKENGIKILESKTRPITKKAPRSTNADRAKEGMKRVLKRTTI
jgi:hypothetical protein